MPRRMAPCALLALSLLGPGCGDAASSGSAGAGRPRGEALYADWSCGACHGEARQGTEFGPPLTGVAATWTVDELTGFLADPETGSKPHLLEMKQTFPAPMPGFREPEPDRRALAAWLLQKRGERGVR